MEVGMEGDLRHENPYEIGTELKIMSSAIHGKLVGIQRLGPGNLMYGLKVEGIEPIQWISDMIIERWTGYER